MRELVQSTAANVMVFMTDSSDHVSGKTGLTLTITASKDGAAFASISPTVTERGSGWYNVALTTSHTDTTGDLALHVTATGADPSDLVSRVIATKPADVLKWKSGTVVSPNTTGVPIVDVGYVNGSAASPAGTVDANLVSDGGGIIPDALSAYGVALTTDLTPLSNNQATLLTRLSATRANNLDNLDATVSSRSTLTQSQVTGGAYALQTDASGYLKLSSGTGTGQISLSSGTVTVGAFAASLMTGGYLNVNVAYIQGDLADVYLASVGADILDNQGLTTTLFSGITSMAQWLGLIAGKQTGNTTARTELRATGAGSGTFDETTDSLEALKDNGVTVDVDEDAIADAVAAQLGGQTISVSNPVDPNDDNRLTIYQGFDMTSGSYLPSWTVTGYNGPSLSGGACKLRLVKGWTYNGKASFTTPDLEVSATISQASTTLTITASLTAAQTGTLDSYPPRDRDTYKYLLAGITSGNVEVPIVYGWATVVRDIPPSA